MSRLVPQSRSLLDQPGLGTVTGQQVGLVLGLNQGNVAAGHFLMIRVGALLIVLMITPAKAGKVDITYCAQAPDVTAGRLKSAFARAQNSKLRKDDSCRVYRSEFYEAAVTRQDITHCEQDDIRQHTLQVINAAINAFNDLIATYCAN